jgi:hypothetical protein
VTKREGLEAVGLLLFIVAKVECRERRRSRSGERRGVKANLLNLLDLLHIIRGSADNANTPNVAEHVLILLHVRQGIHLFLLLFFGDSGELPVVLDLGRRLLDDGADTPRKEEGRVVVVGVLEPTGEETLALLVVEDHGSDGAGVVACVGLIQASKELIRRLARPISISASRGRYSLREGPHRQ